MKTLGQALAIGVLLLTFAGCDDDDNAPPDTINVQTAPDGGPPDALPNLDSGEVHCRAFGKLGDACFLPQ